MKNRIPYSVPILLDEMTIIYHKKSDVISARAYADVTNNSSYYIFSKMNRDRSITSSKFPIGVRAIEERERTIKRRKVRERVNVTAPWLQNLQNEVTLKNPVKKFVFDINGKKTTATISMNPDYPAEVFVKIGNEITVVSKEIVKDNSIFALGAAAAGYFIQDQLDDLFNGPPIGFKIEISVSEDGCSIKISIDGKVFY